MWVQKLFEAISEYEMKNPGKLEKVVLLDPTKDWSDEEWKLYNDAACVIVEPNAFLGEYPDEDMEVYYEKCEMNGFEFVKGQIDPTNNSELWKKVIDLVDQMGY